MARHLPLAVLLAAVSGSVASLSLAQSLVPPGDPLPFAPDLRADAPVPWQIGPNRQGFIPEAPPIMCFAPGTSQEKMEAINQAIAAYMDSYFASGTQWGTQGSPITITWSMVPDGLSIPGDPQAGDATSPSTLFASMDAKFGGIAHRAEWIAQVQSCFDRWAQITGIQFTRVASGGNEWDDGAVWGSFSNANRGTMRISMHPIDGLNNILAFCYFPTGANGKAGDMVIDSAENWHAGSATGYKFLRNTLTHEMGHGLGLFHVCPANGTKLMEPFLDTSYDGPQHDDLRGGQFLYGDPFESNNTAATATNLVPTTLGGTLDPSTIPFGTPIDHGVRTSLFNGDVDWFKTSVVSSMLASFTLSPVGESYDSSTQNANGTCGSGNEINSVAAADMAFEVVGPDGVSVWASGNTAVAGAAEVATGVLLSPGNYYIRVFENGVPSGAQLYDLSIHGNTLPILSASDGVYFGLVHTSWTAVPNATQYAVYRNTSNNRAGASLRATIAPTTAWDDDAVAVGTTYYYWVEAQQGAGGLRPLAGPETGYASTHPINDDCANALPLGIDSTSGDNTTATNDSSASCGNSSTSKDVWYKHTALTTGQVRITTCGSHDRNGVDLGIDTVLSVYSGCPGTPGALQLACNDDANPTTTCAGLDTGVLRDSAVFVNVTQGQQLMIRVAGYQGATGFFSIHLGYTAPANDLCANATLVGNGTTSFATYGALTDGPLEPNGPCNVFGSAAIEKDVWFKYHAPCNGTAALSLCGSDFDTKVAVYNSCPAGPDTAITCNDDFCGYQSSLTFAATANTDYLIRVGGFQGSTGHGSMNLSCTATCGSADFDGDGDTGTDADIEAFFACLAGNCCAMCGTPDFNYDGDTGTDADIEAFFRVLGGGNC